MPVFLAAFPPALAAYAPPIRPTATLSPAAQTSAKQAILASYQVYDAAWSKRNVNGIFSVFTPDARLTDSGQTLTVGQAKAGFVSFMPRWTGPLAFSTRIDAWTFGAGGQTVSVMTTKTLNGIFQGQQTRFVATERDMWRKATGGIWRIEKQETLKQTVDVTPPTPTLSTAEREGVLSQIKSAAAPLMTVEAGHGFDDLASFGSAVGEARIVALGEASHGTREFFQMKHRLLEYLVKEKGFTVFAIEANYPEVLAVDAYIKTGAGDAQAALQGTYFWTWYTREVLDQIEWMRLYNKTRPPGTRALSFTGFDMQTADVAQASAQAFLQKVGGAKPFLPQTKDKVADAKVLLARFDKNAEAYVKASSQSEYDVARQCALVTVQARAQEAGGMMVAVRKRDEAMANNVKWLFNTAHPGEKIVLWAHNGHVAGAPYGQGGMKPMGSYLRETFGKDLYIVGFAFNKGAIRAVPMHGGKITGAAQPLPVSPALPGTADALFAQTQMPRFFLNMDNVSQSSALGKWLHAPQVTRMPGAAWDKDRPNNFAVPLAFAKTYDGLVFINESHASQALNWLPIPPAQKAPASK